MKQKQKHNKTPTNSLLFREEERKRASVMCVMRSYSFIKVEY